ncbi:unnamed protein product [Kluyveromyces dobzhanskii CBS 2104]|uniref:WGS project CCBQ000000000 data, contig 00046 n=1 Tax=Kluyveromyces dobzhanskii CBS 2104 TaxID=1427455 RepID=A0A0A8L6V8_9SACH|nr:unnamed protein product [Kluyveromyces dobzhanskii CBS 2104]
MAPVVLVGVVAAIVANALQALGLVFQRKAECIEMFHYNSSELGLHMQLKVPPRPIVYRNKTWQLGFLLFLLANLFGCVIQIATLPLIVLAPLQASGLVFNSLFSHIILREPFPFVATVFVCAGGTIMASMSCTYINTPLTHTFEELCELAQDERFVRYFVGSNALAVLLIVVGVCAVCKRVKGFSLVFASGIWSAHALLIAKCVSNVIVTEWSISVHIVVLLVILITFSLTQLYLLNAGLAHLSTSILYPFVFSIYNLTTILNSTMFYHDSLVPHTAQFLYTGLTFGFIVLTIGVVRISASIYYFEESLIHDPKLFSEFESSHSPSSSTSSAALLSYGSLNNGRPLSEEFTQESNTYTSLAV